MPPVRRMEGGATGLNMPDNMPDAILSPVFILMNQLWHFPFEILLIFGAYLSFFLVFNYTSKRQV